MSEADKILAAVDEMIAKYPDATVQMKFHGSDTVRNFTEESVKNDSVANPTVATVVSIFEEDFCDSSCDSLKFSEWFKINSLTEFATVATPVRHLDCRTFAHATAERHLRPPLGGLGASGSDALSGDWANLREKEFRLALAKIGSVEELRGLANRKKVLGLPYLKPWSAVQRDLIMERKFELENGDG